MKLTAESYGDLGQSCIYLNKEPLVGTALDEDTCEVIVGHWPDGEEWVELFRVPDGHDHVWVNSHTNSWRKCELCNKYERLDTDRWAGDIGK